MCINLGVYSMVISYGYFLKAQSWLRLQASTSVISRVGSTQESLATPTGQHHEHQWFCVSVVCHRRASIMSISGSAFQWFANDGPAS